MEIRSQAQESLLSREGSETREMLVLLVVLLLLVGSALHLILGRVMVKR